MTKEYKSLQFDFHEAVAIMKIISLHDLPNEEFQNELGKVDRNFTLPDGTLKLQQLAVILKAADILHTDSSRIARIGVDASDMNNNERKKHLARESISGWRIDGSRIILNAIPETQEHFSALQGCKKYIEEKEWPAVEEKLSDYSLPYDLYFEIDTSICGDPSEQKKNK